MQKINSNEDLIQLINGSDKDMNQAVQWIYNKSGWVRIARKLVRNLGGSVQDQEDIIQEGIISFIMDIQKSKLKNSEGAKAYFIRSCKNIWLNQFNRSVKGKEIIDREFKKEERNGNYSFSQANKEFWEHLDHLLEQLGRKCKDVLKLWSMGYSHDDIAKKIGYENANVSKKTKSLCIEKLKKLGLNPDELKP